MEFVDQRDQNVNQGAHASISSDQKDPDDAA